MSVLSVPEAAAPVRLAPSVALTALDQLWFQVAGTVCNLRCTHCFISCGPTNHAFWFMRPDQVRDHLHVSQELGVKEYYFTGGEPFMNAGLLTMLQDTLAIGPATVLTNGTLLPQRTVSRLWEMAAASRYSLELRVSLDGVTESANDAIRGRGTFARALGGVRRLAAAGFLPIVTAMQTWDEAETERVVASFRRLLAAAGCRRARVKIIPPIRIGAEATRDRGYAPSERVTHEMLQGFDLDHLLCTRARLVTATGVHACPILLGEPSARMGNTLREAAARRVRLGAQACFTCYTSGALCANVPASGRDLQ